MISDRKHLTKYAWLSVAAALLTILLKAGAYFSHRFRRFVGRRHRIDGKSCGGRGGANRFDGGRSATG